ncbi:MAG: hypothetical protein ABIH22_00770, partial [Candidatus Margulisiibacteriota bacterium]
MKKRKLSTNQITNERIRLFVYISLIVVFWILIFGFSSLASALDINGYYESDFVGVVKRTGGGILGNLKTIRFRIDSKLSDNINLHLEPEYNFLLKSGDFSLTGVSGIDQLVWDRAYFKVFFPQVDITLGKQRIAWGTGYIWNPTNVLNPFTLSFAVQEEDEEDVVAARFEVPLGVSEGIDAYVLSGDTWENTTKGIKAKANFANYDLSVSYVD